jgi:hypothetical protein
MNDNINDVIFTEMKKAALEIGRVEWGATPQLDAQGHAEQTKTAVEGTADHFQQDGLQKMHGLYLSGTEITLCDTGTSPNSATHARILTALWNHFVECVESERQTHEH